MTSTMAEPGHSNETQLSGPDSADVLAHITQFMSAAPILACALEALLLAGDTFDKQQRVDFPSAICKLYPDGLRRLFFRKPVFDKDGNFLSLGTYDRRAESEKSLNIISFPLALCQVYYICTHSAALDADASCGFLSVRLERLYEHMDHKHFKDGDVTKDEKRLHADLVLAAFLPDIDDIEGLIKRRGGQNWSGMDMPTLLYKRDIFPIREQLEARARDVLAVCPNPNPVRAPTLASGTMLAPQQTTGAGSHLPSFVFGASSAALGPVAPIAGFDASATTFPYSTFAHSTNDNSEVDPAIVSPPTHDANSALAPPAFTYDESDAGSFDLAPSFPAGTHSTTFTFEHALPMPSRSDIYDGHEASDFASRPVPISPSHETADSFGAWIQEQKRREDEAESRGKMARAGKAGRALAAAPYGRPGITSRGGDAIAGSSRIRSSSVASHASTSSLDTVHSSASGYSTSASFTSSDSHPQSSRSSSFAPASREGSFGLYAHGHTDTDYTLGINPQYTADVPQLPMAVQHEGLDWQEFKRLYGAPGDH